MSVLATLALAVLVNAQEPEPRRAAPWPPEVVEQTSALAVQEGGRIKPLSTFASFTLLRLSGRRTLTLPDGERLGAVEWLLDTLLFPEAAERQPVFLVEDHAVLAAVGIDLGDKRRRDRWSLAELRPGLGRLFDLAHRYAALEAGQRVPLQRQVVDLAEAVNLYGSLLGGLAELAIVPPVDPEREAWWTPGELFERAAGGEDLAAPHLQALLALQDAVAARGEPASVAQELGRARQELAQLAAVRGEGGKIGLERAYYRARPITWSLVAFVAAFLAATLVWLRPRARVLYGATVGLVGLATALLVGAVAVRCVLRGRPPVSTLYETVLFVTATGALIALAIEAIDRRRVAVSAAALFGTIGLFLANGYEALDKRDTMPSLVAVLDTNFWLSTHVTAITLGYSAGMLAALLGSLYLVAKLFGWKRGDRGFYAGLGRSVYGVLCFALIFSTVGTILGGVWANESWGRFWGWDPKENGALLIVISQLVILHARRGGHLREHGVCAAAAFGGTVIAFSWWGVNLLGVGLHSYGFTSGVHRALWTYYGLQWGVVALGGLAWLRERRAARGDAPATPLASAPTAPGAAARGETRQVA